ncbi:MAG: sulfotransferase domain-containing protein [Chloroflexota bacterium]
MHEVYGMESSAFQLDPSRQKEDYLSYPVVKTHVLPHQLEPSDPSIPVVYLVRDGRDSVVSMAHHTKDIVQPGSDYKQNLKEIILARHGSHFGGWGNNVLTWLKRAALVIRFEDLITEPVATVEKLRSVIDLPEPQPEKLPTFDDLREKSTPYGPNKKKSGQEDYGEKKKKFFRRGIAGAWKDELPLEYQEMFWFFNSEAMRAVGYTEGEMAPKANLTGRMYKFLDDHFVDQNNIERLKNRLSASSWDFNE